MKRVLCAIAALALAVPTFAIAKDNKGRDHDNGRGRGPSEKAEILRVPPGHVRTFTYQGKARPAIAASAFRYPSGYNYVRWNVGGRLPAVFIAAPYFFSDYGPLGLSGPPPGHRWVRYGPDLLLVDLRSGRVNDAAYNVFYF